MRASRHIPASIRSDCCARSWVNFRDGGVRQGGSTITQQLAKNLFLSSQRTLTRKATEAVLALILEVRMTKQEILEAYLNNVYLGQSESIGIYGVGQARSAFFAKDVRDLSVAEAATIAGVDPRAQRRFAASPSRPGARSGGTRSSS